MGRCDSAAAFDFSKYKNRNNGCGSIVSEWLDDEKMFAEISKMLAAAGFDNIEKRALVGPVSIVVGYKC